MKFVKALDKETGAPVKLINAASVTEATRRAFNYQCPYTGCTASFHWVRDYTTHGNTEHHDATFARDKDSSHQNNCPGDRKDEYNLHENIDYISEIGGVTHVRINFPLGSAKVDKFPRRGYLTAQQLAAAQDQKVIQPYGSLAKLAQYIEQKFGSLESMEAGDIRVHYQGNDIEWRKLFKGSDRYDKLYWRTQNRKHSDDGKDTPPIVTVVRPVRELDPSKKGHSRYECEEQVVEINGRKQHVVPVIVCDRFNSAVGTIVAQHMVRGHAMFVSARPFYAGIGTKSAPFGGIRISLYVHSVMQLAQAQEKYWHADPALSQQDLFKNKGDEPPAPSAL